MGRRNKDRRRISAAAAVVLLLLTGCAHAPEPVTETETQTVIYTVSGQEAACFSASDGITPVGDKALFERRRRNEKGDVTCVSYYAKDFKTGEEALLGTLERRRYEQRDSTETVIGSHVYRLVSVGNWWSDAPKKDAELALYDFDLNAGTMRRLGAENYRVTDASAGTGIKLCAYGEALLIQKGGEILRVDPESGETRVLFDARNEADTRVLELSANGENAEFSVLVQSESEPSRLLIRTCGEDGRVLKTADFSACLQTPAADFDSSGGEFCVLGDYVYFRRFTTGESAGESPELAVLAKEERGVYVPVADFANRPMNFVPSYAEKTGDFLFAFGNTACRFSVQNGTWKTVRFSPPNSETELREWRFDGTNYWISAVKKDGSDYTMRDGGYETAARYCRVTDADLCYRPAARP